MILDTHQDLHLMRALNCSWSELQGMPEDVVEVMAALLAGEAEGQELRAGQQQGKRGAR